MKQAQNTKVQQQNNKSINFISQHYSNKSNLMYQYRQQPSQQLERLKQIQKSNNHVNNLIQNAKKMIYNQKQLSQNEKEVLEIKISIEKDHLKNAFYKIDCPDEDFRVEIVRKGFERDNKHYETPNTPKGSFKSPSHRQEQRTNHFPQQINQKLTKQQHKYNQGIQKNHLSQHQQQQELIEIDQIQSLSQQPDTKITISRYVQQQQNHVDKQPIKTNRSVEIYDNQQQDQYEIDLSNGNSHQMVYIKPSKNSKLVVKTRTEPLNDQDQRQMSKSYFVNKEKLYQKQEYTPTFSTYRKNRQQTLNQQLSNHSELQQSPSQPHYEQQINIKTPRKQLQIITTQTQQRLFMKSVRQRQHQTSQKKKSPKTQSFTFNHIQPNRISSYQNYKSKQQLQGSQPSTSYKQILQKNKQRLQNSREKLTPHHQTPKTPRSDQYQLHLDKLLQKKSQSKKRLYGPTIESSPKPLQSSISSTTKKYSIANSHKIGSKITDSRRKDEKPRKSLSISKNINSPSSQSRKSPLHSTTLKSYHAPCSTCSKCKEAFSSPKESKKAFQSFYLAKKYLTPEGEKECYNFLRSQGIPQTEWPTFITQYVFRQLSRAYQQASPRQRQLGESQR